MVADSRQEPTPGKAALEGHFGAVSIIGDYHDYPLSYTVVPPDGIDKRDFALKLAEYLSGVQKGKPPQNKAIYHESKNLVLIPIAVAENLLAIKILESEGFKKTLEALKNPKPPREGEKPEYARRSRRAVTPLPTPDRIKQVTEILEKVTGVSWEYNDEIVKMPCYTTSLLLVDKENASAQFRHVLGSPKSIIVIPMDNQLSIPVEAITDDILKQLEAFPKDVVKKLKAAFVIRPVLSQIAQFPDDDATPGNR
jgi:hypothetical protein